MKIIGLKITNTLIDERAPQTNEGFLHIYEHSYNADQQEIKAAIRVFASQAAWQERKTNWKVVNVHIPESYVIEKALPETAHDALNEAYRRIQYSLSLKGINSELVEEVINE